MVSALHLPGQRAGRLAQDDADLLLGLGQPLAGAQVERHAAPAGVVDPQPGRDVGVPGGPGRHPGHVAVAVELAEHHLGRVERPERLDDLLPGRLQVGGAQAGRRLHRDLGGHLEQVGDQHVEHRAGGVVEHRTVGDAELFRHVDLHRLDVLPVPHGGEQAVREAQHVQVLGGLLAQEMVDPVDLLLVQHRVDDPVQGAERLRRRAERLLVDDPGALGQPVLAQGLGHLAEGDRRHGQVVHELRVAAQRLARLGQDVEQAARAVGVEAAAGEEQPLGERLPVGLLRLRAELLERVADVRAEVLVRDVAAAVADQPPLLGQQALEGQPVERGEHHPLGQVAGRPEQDEDRRLQVGAGLAGRLLVAFLVAMP